MTTWFRLEGNTRSTAVEHGLEARVADPLWLLGRQWQFGELRGEDGGSPVSVRVETSSWPLSSYAPRIDDDDEAVPLPLAGTDALRARVEAERTQGAASFRHRVESGLQFLRALEAHGAGALRAAFIAAFPLTVPDVDDAEPARSQRRLEILARGSVDADALLAAGVAVADEIPGEGPVSASLHDGVQRAWETWSAWYATRTVRPQAGERPAWRTQRLEHAFTVGAVTNRGPVALGAAEYDGRDFDWSSFDLVPTSGEPAPDRPPVAEAFELLPMPVTFRGMPTGRFWEMEDHAVSFGSVTTAPHDIARMLLVEHATIYSDDWLVVPVRARLGNLVGCDRVAVATSFGERRDLPSKAELDEATGKPRHWRFGEPTVKRRAEASLPHLLFLPPALSPVLEGEALERVDFVRDEAANLAWAIERRVEGAARRSRDREQEWQQGRAATPPPTTTAATTDGAWQYRAETETAPFWIPFVPERLDGSEQMILRRARLASWPADAGAKGTILEPHRSLRLFEEEVQRGGVSVLRKPRAARDSDGRLHVWIARLKQPGRGDRLSGLRHDVIEGIE